MTRQDPKPWISKVKVKEEKTKDERVRGGGSELMGIVRI
jgi:hypothetical protein